MEQQAFYNAAIYCRLSKDDLTQGESSSIQTQKALLTKFVTDNGWRVVSCYVDDGISGTTFERSGFKQMIEDIEGGKINMVVTKDAYVKNRLKNIFLNFQYKVPLENKSFTYMQYGLFYPVKMKYVIPILL